jgi:hypothetical protein
MICRFNVVSKLGMCIASPFCVKLVLKLKVSLAVLNKVLIFAVLKGNKLLTSENKYYGNNDIKTIL